MDTTLIDEFIDLACLKYGGDNADRYVQASALLAANPGLATASIWSAATVGDAAAVAAFLDADPALLEARGGPREWEPLMYACYSRATSPEPTHDTLAVARVLLERGANADAHFLWDGRYPFTALTGAFGEGEGGPAAQPRHPQWRELATLLLDHGARVDENQGLYNRLFAEDDECLEMLLARGLGPDVYPRDNETGGKPPPTMLGYQLCLAAGRGRESRLRLLLAHGAHMDERAYGLTPWEQAMHSGHRDLARILEEAGAPTTELSPVEQLVSLCLAGDVDAAQAFVATDPTLPSQLPDDILERAVGTHDPGPVELLLALGLDVNACPGTTALHQAAWNDDRAMVDLLLAHGADPTIRDKNHQATPADWANHAGHTTLSAHLRAIADAR